MREIIINFPKQFKLGLKAAEDIKLKGNFKAVLVCAMGGSALSGDLLDIYFEDQKIKTPLFVHKDYNLPRRINENHLIICISYSGDTQETITAYQEALKRESPLVVIASGGKLGSLCEKNKTPWAQVPVGLPPRMAIGYQFGALLKILINAGLLPQEAEKELLSLEKKLEPAKLEAKAKELAKKIKDKIPVVYASGRLKPLAYIWKIKFNETAKIPAFYNVFPELDHNELSSFENQLTKLFVLILKDTQDNQKIADRIKLTAEIIKRKKAGLEIIDLDGKDIFYKIFSNIILADWTTFHLASLYRTDPISIKLQEGFKKKIQKS